VDAPTLEGAALKDPVSGKPPQAVHE
jgi:hypothetical protein